MKRGVCFNLLAIVCCGTQVTIIGPILRMSFHLSWFDNVRWIIIVVLGMTNNMLSLAMINLITGRILAHFVRIKQTQLANKQLSLKNATTGTNKNTTTNTENTGTETSKSMKTNCTSTRTIAIWMFIAWVIESGILFFWRFVFVELLVGADNYQNMANVMFLFLNVMFCTLYVVYGIIIVIVVKRDEFKLNDYWYIKDEFNNYGKILMFLCIVGVLGAVLVFAFPNISYTIWIIANILFVLSIAFAAYIGIIWVEKVNTANNNCNTNNSKEKTNSNSNINIFIGTSQQKRELKAINLNLNMLAVDNISGQDTCTDHNCSEHETPVMTQKVSKLYQFFDLSFDVENEYSNVNKEFRLFRDHCIRELTMENLLFWIHFIQFTQFLVEYHFIDENDNIFVNYRCNHYIENLQFIQQLKDNVDNSDKECVDYNLLIPFYKSLFNYFIEANKATFEINIGYEVRNKLTNYYEIVSDDSYQLTKDFFMNNIWPCIKETAIEILQTYTEPAFYRFLTK